MSDLQLFLDVSRLLSCAGKPAPSGIDRVEYAYARHWADALGRGAAVTFVATDVAGRFAAIAGRRVQRLLAELAQAWAGRPESAAASQRARRLATRIRATLPIAPVAARLVRAASRPVFLLVSHRFLERRSAIAAMRLAGAAFVPLIHDLIPMTHPEYARPGQPAKHARRIATAVALADAVITNSAATAAVFAPHLAARQPGPLPPVAAAPLGIEPVAPAAPVASTEAPYFLALGTIEPRKNHMLLLHLWRDLLNRPDLAPHPVPRLVIVGRRGWENENVVDLLDRCEVLRGHVEERGAVPEAVLAGLLAGARALLFPSFAEGYGLPLAEALAAGVPAICSDLPALREVGGAVPDYLDPLDGLGWRCAVLDYARPDCAAREAQLARMAAWRPPSWDDHFAVVDRLLPLAVQHRAAAGVAPPLATAGLSLAT